ncbi:MAG: prepilin-type N-terminal cleavage/methylation domain-containing protein [Myxococcota bacterium]
MGGQQLVIHRTSSGMTLIELVIVLAIIGVAVQFGAWGIQDWADSQRVRTSARAVADAFHLGRAEAIRTGNNHLVVFNQVLGATADIEVANDGEPSSQNCTVETGETIHQVALESSVAWGTGAAVGVAPDDPGSAPANIANGSSFTDATRIATNAAYAVLFQPDGLPRVFTQNAGTCVTVGLQAQGGGAIYLNNDHRDFAVVLSHLGTTRVHLWNHAGGWIQ